MTDTRAQVFALGLVTFEITLTRLCGLNHLAIHFLLPDKHFFALSQISKTHVHF